MASNEIWDLILSLEREYFKYKKNIMNKFSISAAETDILMFLANNPEFDTAAHISKIRKIPKSQVSLSVTSLYEKSLLKGIYKNNNKKSVHLTPTEKAMPIIAYGHKMQENFLQSLFWGFTDKEKAEFSRLHLKIAENIETKRNDIK